METRSAARSSAASLHVSPDSSPQSFQSAKSIGSSPLRQPTTTNTPTPLFRQVKNLPYELREQVTVYFEEGLHIQALNFLKAVLTSGNTSIAQRPAIVPPPHHFSLIATLAVHPTLTTRAKSIDRIQAANLALRYLRLVVRHVGPLPHVLGEAFVFASQDTVVRRRGKSKRKTMEEGPSPNNEYIESIDTELANTESLWARAEDFWQIVGWSFNCSVLHKRRWERWSIWLDFMIELLELDWDLRKGESGVNVMEKSLIVKYINFGNSTAARERKIVKAVFADGRPKAVAEFGEIWQNETKELKTDAALKRVEAKIDIEADNYGDYMEDEFDDDLEDSASNPSSLPADTDPPSIDAVPNICAKLGGRDSINLRVRLLSLLSKVSDALPAAFTPITTLYHNFFEHIRPLPIPAFFAIMSPPSLALFEPTAASTLTQYVLRSIIAAAAPVPPTDDISQEVFQTCYLPFSANTISIVDNTKVSLCVETLLRLLDKHCGLDWSPALQDLAEAGIRARTTKARGKQKKKCTNGEGVCDMTWLTSSSERIRMVVEMARP